jgi:hypothetical protein
MSRVADRTTGNCPDPPRDRVNRCAQACAPGAEASQKVVPIGVDRIGGRLFQDGTLPVRCIGRDPCPAAAGRRPTRG